jgi:hypothetical protein
MPSTTAASAGRYEKSLALASPVLRAQMEVTTARSPAPRSSSSWRVLG